eukprot:gene897-977_t
MRVMSSIFACFLFFLLLISVVYSDDLASSASNEEKTLASFQSLKTKELRAFLKARGVECKGCSEKADFVQLAFDSQHLPEQTMVSSSSTEPPSEEPAADSGTGAEGSDASQGPNSDELDEIISKLKMKNGAAPKVFRPGDFEGLSPEEIADKINGGGKVKKGKKARKGEKKEKGKEGEKTKKSEKKKAEKKPEKKKEKKEKKDETHRESASHHNKHHKNSRHHPNPHVESEETIEL